MNPIFQASSGSHHKHTENQTINPSGKVEAAIAFVSVCNSATTPFYSYGEDGEPISEKNQLDPYQLEAFTAACKLLEKYFSSDV